MKNEEKVEMKPELRKDGMIVINTKAHEVLTPETFLQFYANRQMNINTAEAQIEKMRHELNELGEVKETDALLKLAEDLEMAKKINEKKNLVEGLKKLEKQLVEHKELAEPMVELHSKLMKMRDNK